MAEVRRLERDILAVETQIAEAVETSGTTLVRLFGIGPILAAKIIGRTGDIRRFSSSARFASYCGVAPIEASSGDVIRHRLSRAGDRQLRDAQFADPSQPVRCVVEHSEQGPKVLAPICARRATLLSTPAPRQRGVAGSP